MTTPGTTSETHPDRTPHGSVRRRAWRPLRMSLAATLGSIYGVVLVISLGLVLGLTATSNYRNTFNLLNDKAVLLMRTLTDRVRLHLEPAGDAIREFAMLYRNDVFDIDDPQSQDDVITGMLTASDVLDAIVVYDLQLHRTGLYRAGDADFRQLSDLGPMPAMPMPAEQRLRQIGPDDPPSWGPLAVVDGEPFVNVVAPLSRNGRIDGYAVAAVSAGVMSELVGRVGIEEGATTFLLYGEEAVFAHSRGKALGLQDKQTDTRGAVPLAIAGDPVLARYGERDVLSPFSKARSEGVEVSEIDDRDDEYIVMTRRIDQFGPVPWIAGLYLPREELGDEIARLYGSIIAGFAMLLITVGIAVVVSQRLARPLTRLSAAAECVERFELEKVEPLPSSPVAEVDATATAFNRMVVALRAFAAYVPRALVQRMLSLGYDEATRLESRSATVLFTDIVGFTALSERMQTRDVARLLNAHFATLVACVEAHGGIVDKFIGDGMLAVWSSTDAATDAANAVAAALAIAVGAHDGFAQSADGHGIGLRLRIGIHSGPVLAGNLGAAGRVNYTVIGDTVNVASRLEALGKAVDPEASVVILASNHTVELAREAGFVFEAREVGEWALRGRAGRVDVVRISVPPPSTALAQLDRHHSNRVEPL